ncbi:MAG: hypothetical protein AAGA35_00200 [Patescibacteria group bacterium]
MTSLVDKKYKKNSGAASVLATPKGILAVIDDRSHFENLTVFVHECEPEERDSFIFVVEGNAQVDKIVHGSFGHYTRELLDADAKEGTVRDVEKCHCNGLQSSDVSIHLT